MRLGDETVRLLLDVLLIPYTVGLYSLDHNHYLTFISGEGFEDLRRFIKSDRQLQNLLVYTLFPNDKFEERLEAVILEEFEKLYYTLIRRDDKYGSTSVGTIQFRNSELDRFNNNISLLGDIAIFDKEKVKDK